MLQVARLAPNQLHEAGDQVVDFLRGEFNEDGGVKDRGGKSDLYYTVFGLDALIAMRVDPPNGSVRNFLEEFGDGASLDSVHLACLARCWAALPAGSLSSGVGGRILARIERFRANDGGYAARENAPAGSAYLAFLAYGAYQDLRGEIPYPDRLAASLDRLQAADGGFSNEPGLPEGSTPATAAAVTLLRQLGRRFQTGAGDWLLARAVPGGGFRAAPRVPVPDLLSTATALHALAGMEVSFEPIKERCLDFVDTLWTGKGFCGHWGDDVVDTEYTFYALLALGHLSL